MNIHETEQTKKKIYIYIYNTWKDGWPRHSHSSWYIMAPKPNRLGVAIAIHNGHSMNPSPSYPSRGALPAAVFFSLFFSSTPRITQEWLRTGIHLKSLSLVYYTCHPLKKLIHEKSQGSRLNVKKLQRNNARFHHVA